MTDKVQISSGELKTLISNSLMLRSLQEWGVSNWSEYHEATVDAEEIYQVFDELTKDKKDDEGKDSTEPTVREPSLLYVSMKDPDSLYDAVQDYLANDDGLNAMDEDEAEAIRGLRQEKIQDAVSGYFKYGEYVLLEFDITDMDNVKARLVPENERSQV